MRKLFFNCLLIFTILILVLYIYFNKEFKKVKTEEQFEDEGRYAEEKYFSYTRKVDSRCEKVVRLGSAGEGGWDMCISAGLAPAQPCLAYSFGIRTDWSFDDTMSTKYNCTVRSFDPSIKTATYRRNPNLWFYHEGIGGRDEVNEHNWTLSTLSTLRLRFNEVNTIIDYLKIDVDYSEWDLLETALMDGSLLKVRQMGLEVHTKEWQKVASTKEDYERYYKLLIGLENLGFKRWKSHLNPQSLAAKSPYTGKMNMCCSEFNYFNRQYASLLDATLN